MKADKIFEFGQCPMLEIKHEDGWIERYTQTFAITRYLAIKFQLKPPDSQIDLVYRGEVISEHFIDDIVKKHFNYVVWYAAEEEKPKLFD